MEIGISQIGIKIPSKYISTEELAKVRGMPVKKATEGLEVSQARIPFGTTVIDLAIAAIEKIDYQNVKRFYIATESNPDLSKPEIAIKICQKLELHNVEVVQLEFACLAGIQALILACEYSATTGQAAIVVPTDRSIYRSTDPAAEITQGCGAVAIRIEPSPDLLICDFRNTGVYIEDVDDFRVPYYSFPYPEIQGNLSVISYLHCMKQAFENWKENNKEITERLKRENLTVLDYFDFFAFHTPYLKMVKRAAAMLFRHERLNQPHLTVEEFLLNSILFEKDKESIQKVQRIPEFQEFYERKVLPTLKYNSKIGNCYTASVFISLIAALEKAKEDDEIGLGGYGSGAGAIAIRSKVVKGHFKSDLGKQVEGGEKISIKEYEKWRETYNF